MAVVGTGFGARVHVPGFRLIEGVQVVALVGGQLERTRALAQAANIPHAYDSVEAMLDAEAVDLVSIATPPHLHATMVKRAAEHGCHVICEKPLAVTLAEAEDMAHVMQARGLVHAVTHQFRYFPGIAAFKREVSRGVLGEARVVRLLSLTDARATPEKSCYSWWSDRTARWRKCWARLPSHWIGPTSSPGELRRAA